MAAMVTLAPWRQRLQRARFRHAAFYIKSGETQVGRRVVLHEYPQRDQAYPEDLGQKADQFTIEAIIIGPGYTRDRDALIAALKQPGPGTLIHPYYGSRTVTLVSPARISESTEEGGIARFTLEFTEAGENTEPHAREDTQASVETAADQARAATANDFSNNFSLEGAPEFVERDALDWARSAIDSLTSIADGLAAGTALLSDYALTATQIMHDVNRLIRAPAAFAQRVLGLVGSLKALAKSPLVALRSYQGLFDFGGNSPRIRPTTAARTQQAANRTALSTLLRRAALIEAARSASRLDMTASPPNENMALTYEQAVAIRDDLAARLDDEAAGLVRDSDGKTTLIDVAEPVYRTLSALITATTRDLTARAIDAPRLDTVTLPMTLPALVAAYRVLGEPARAGELIARNPSIRHPGFVPGGTSLTITSR